MSSLSRVQSCLWTVTRCGPLVQQKLLTCIRAHEFTQPCSILSLNSDTMCAPNAAETSYLYQSKWVHPACSILSLKSDTMGAPSAAEISYLYQSTSVLFNLVLSCRWTVTRCVLLVQQKLLTFISAHEFTQPCSILSLNSDTMCAPHAAETSHLYHSTETSYLYQSTWVHSVLFNIVSGQWHDVCP